MGNGLLGIVAIVLIILKLAGVILWPWWIVLIPVWIGMLIFSIVVVGVVVAAWIASEW